ncbi:DNA methyltransferase [[Eubacterium] cellulosolvens]
MVNKSSNKLIPWLPTTRTCKCPTTAMNCLNERQWLRNQVPIWWFSANELGIRYDQISRRHHPAIFPTALAKRVIENYTHPSETVLDTFSGMGTTLYASRLVKRNCIGFELNKKFSDLTAKRLKLNNDRYCLDDASAHNRNRQGLHLHQICTPSSNLLEYIPPKSIDLVFTSPPYWDLLSQKPSQRNIKNQKFLKENYSDDPLDLSNNATLEGFTNNIRDIFKNIRIALKPGKRCIVNTADYRRKGKYISLSSIYINVMQELGFELRNVIIWDRRKEYDIGLFSYPRNFVVNNGMFEYLLEFKI